MIHQKSPLMLWLLCLVTLAPGCGTWLGNPKDPDKTKPQGNSLITLSVQGGFPEQDGSGMNLAEDPISVLGKTGTPTGTIVLTTARISLSTIRLRIDTGDSKEIQEFAGPFVANLLGDTLSPAPETVEVPNGIYKQIELSLAKLPDDSEGVLSPEDPLIDRSIVVYGTYKPTDGSAVNVVMDFDLDETFKLAGSGLFSGMEIQEDQINPIIIKFHFNEWFNFTGQEADFEDVKAGTNIDLTQNSQSKTKAVRHAIKDNIKRSARFGKDKNADGKLGKDERSAD